MKVERLSAGVLPLNVGSGVVLATEAGTTHVPAWQEIEPGRYQPRRTRGSFPGRELG